MTIDTMAAILEDNNIPFNIEELWDGYKVTFPWAEGDVICHGAVPHGFVESMGFPWDLDDITQLLPEYMAARIVGDFVNYAGHTQGWWDDEEEF